MNIIGIGVDLADIAKMRKIMSGKAGRRFLENTFTKNELACAGSNIPKLASAFAAKEAVYKAFGTGWIEGKDVELLRHPETGSPRIVLHGEIKKTAKKRKIKNVLVSVSWTDCCAVATVILSS